MNLEILPIHGLPKIKPGDDLIGMLGECGKIESGDILVVTQKIISKAENQLVAIDPTAVSYTHLTLPTICSV